VFENRVLRRIFLRKRREVTGEWKKLHSEKLHSLYSSYYQYSQTKQDRMDRHVAHTEEINACSNFSKHLKGTDYLGKLGLEIRTILKWILWKDDIRM
jgi:hypothetical protein